MTKTEQASLGDVVGSSPLVVVSGDSHIGPRLEEDLRPYCPAGELEAFDEFVSAHRALNVDMGSLMGDPSSPQGQRLAYQIQQNARTAGHYDMQARLHDMDRDGVAAEVIFHGSQNGEPIPFLSVPSDLFFNPSGADLEKARLGLHIYNAWLADAVSTAPDRLVGLASLPMWDVDLAVKEVEWAREAGLRGVNFPTPRAGIPLYDDPVWEPFWSACESLGMVLATHAGGILADLVGLHAFSVVEIETGGWPARRAVHRLVFSGVFERHPGLKIVLTEQNGDWWAATMREYDSTYLTHGWQITSQLPRRPSEYCQTNVFIGASFMAPFEAEYAVRDGYVDNVIWGRDYPHIEGTYQFEDSEGGENMTSLSMRYAFSSIKPDAVRKMVGENGASVYGLDQAKLADTAVQIGAPSLDDLAKPIAGFPEHGGILSFRQVGAWG